MTRRPAPDQRPVALAVAGSDSGGGAGIQADLQAMAAAGVVGTTVVTAVTAQNTRGVDSTHVLPVAEVSAQFESVDADVDLRAIKTGMLGTAEVVETVATHVADVDAPLVVDPVIVAASGDRLLERAAEGAYEALLAEATVVTPNAAEAEVLTGVEPTDEAAMAAAGRELLEMGADAALVTGGHVGDGDEVVDVLVRAGDEETFRHPRVDTDATHGSGCVLSSAVAGRLAQGDELSVAVESATASMEAAIRYHLDVGEGRSPVNPLVGLRERAARQPTAEAVEGAVRALVDADVRRLVPEVGMNVVGATPYAETVGETAAVEGRITKTLSGIAPNRGVRFGASSHVARSLLTAREFDPSLRFAVNCRFDDEVEAALSALEGPIGEFDRSEEPAAVATEEGSTMQWGTRRAFEDADGTPHALIDRGGMGKEPIAKVLAPDAATLVDRTLAVHDAL